MRDGYHLRRTLATIVVVLTIASLLLPIGGTRDISITAEAGGSLEVAPEAPSVEAVAFPDPFDTSVNVTEYPLISRAMMLPGGSTDAIMADINKDGLADLIVGVSGSASKYVSVFYGLQNNTFTSYPSYNISLDRNPISLAVIDRNLDGNLSIVVLEERNDISEREYVEIIEFISNTSYNFFASITALNNPVDMCVGDFNGDALPDLAFARTGADPENKIGSVWIIEGPDFGSDAVLDGGRGSNAIVSGDFNNDTLLDVVLANQYDGNLYLFLQSGTGLNYDKNLTVSGNPVGVVAANLNTDTLADLAVITTAPSAVRFFFQSSGLPSSELFNRTFAVDFSTIAAGDINDDGADDLVFLSRASSIASGFMQLDPADELWPYEPDFTFPTGSSPRNALVGQMSSDSRSDLVIASAREDWSGFSLAVYLGSDSGFANGNATTWTNAYWQATKVDAGDIDGDDVEDLVLLYPSVPSFGYLLSFSGSTRNWNPGYQPTELVLADVDGDGIDEVITAALGGLEITVSSWNPDYTFDSLEIPLMGNLSDFDIEDLNNDSLPDIAVAVDDSAIEIFLNTGEVVPFNAVHDLVLGLAAIPGFTVTLGDFDSDGLQDIAYPAPDCHIGILFQREAGEGDLFPSTPDRVIYHTWSDEDFAELWSCDLTGDGRTDIAARAYGGSEIRFFDQEDFTSSYSSYDGLTFPEAPSFVSVMDATDDGKADVVAMFSSADLAFLYKQDSGVIPDVPSMTFVTGAYPTCAVIGDGTQDHRGDLLICDSSSHSVSIWEQYNFPPIADAGGPYQAYQGDPLVFDGASITGISEIPYMEYRWDFGDGNVADWAREPNPTHTYLELGTFNVTMDVMDPAGLNSTDSTTVEVVDSYPHPDFSWSPLNPHEGEPVTLVDSTYSYDPVVDLTWAVDGIVVSTGLEGTVTVDEFDDGMHTVALTATDSDGSVAAESKTFAVPALAPELSIVAPEAVDEGENVVLSVVVDAWHDGPVDAISSVEWNFSYTGEPFVADVSTGTVNSTTHVFGASGVSEVYVVAVKVTDIDGDSNISLFNIEVFDIGPSAGFSLSPSSPEEGLPFTFEDGTYTYDGIVDWHWTFTYPGGATEEYSLSASEMAAVEFVVGDGSYGMSLEVSETDGDGDSFSMAFDVLEVSPEIVLSVTSGQSVYHEFEDLDLAATVSSYDEVVSYEWDFISLGPQFATDRTTDTNVTTYAYLWAGNYTAKVRVTDADGSSRIEELDLEIVDVPLSGTFEDDIMVSRDDPERTSSITFNASALASRFPDISNTLWEFGDGARELILGAPVEPLIHDYDPVKNYQANLTLTDDDGNVLVLRSSLSMVEPSVQLVTPANNSVIRSGTPVRFIVGDDSLPLVSVEYSIDGGAFLEFETLYEIGTDGWENRTYSIEVRAEDKDGNIAVRRAISITVDDLPPKVTVTYIGTSVFGGDKVNITVHVDEQNLDPDGVVLYVRYPGDDSVSPILMTSSGSGDFYALVEVPMRSGALEYYIIVEDLAGNSATTDPYTLTVKLHLLDVLLPYLLAGAVLAALGTGVYFMRERKISVDETFVIYHDGRMLAHTTRRLKPGMDDQVLSGMFVAIQDFIKDSFKDETSFTLRKLDFGEKSVLVEKGSHVYLAVILHGKASKKVSSRMKMVVDEIEERFSDHLIEWDGDLDKVRGVNEMVKKLYSKAPSLPQGLLGLRR